MFSSVNSVLRGFKKTITRLKKVSDNNRRWACTNRFVAAVHQARADRQQREADRALDVLARLRDLIGDSE